MTTSSETRREGLDHALDLVRQCATDDGFLASPIHRDNYRRVWARDGVIIGLAALMTGEEALVATMRKTLETLARHQGPHGEIPSNVDTSTQRISYGGTTGRVDADLWFVIGCAEYWRATGDDAFLEEALPALERVHFLLGAWEFNDRGLIYVPQTGDWADEYVQSGYILYDQLLYLQALRSLCQVHDHVHGTADHQLQDRTLRLFHLIRGNFWFNGDDPADVYHEVLYEKGRKAAPRRRDHYWMPFFSPTGYGYRFDAFANVLANLFGVARDRQSEQVDAYIAKITPKAMPLLPAFHPIIEPVDRDWESLQMMFSYSFKNRPYEFHNGGLWPMLTGFYVADLARRGHSGKARRHLDAIHAANALSMDDESWSFPEFVHGRELTPGGTRCQGWSAAGAVIAHHGLQGEPLFRIDDDE
ncbi:MAG: amylo-alpha-1,6-glucosidase [Guyparkeria sp.]|uniref:amylo-alpha-1,6-glucosidase n=1 Tax=Guyparkeria sp. TaxID=2035736 RepID=UPI00397AE5B6